MGRVNPIAAVYKLTNVQNGKVYIGETSNFVDRMSNYRSISRSGRKVNEWAKTPISIAIREYGFESFTSEIIVSDKDDPRIADVDYRRKKEARMIKKYNSTDPDYGYNSYRDNRARYLPGTRQSVPHTTRTKLMKADPVLVYDRNDGSTMLYFGAERCAELLGISDRSIVTSAIKHGKTVHGRTFFKLDFGQRMDNAIKIIKEKTHHPTVGNIVKRPSALKLKSLEQYLEGLQHVNEWCNAYHIDSLDIENLMATYSYNANQESDQS